MGFFKKRVKPRQYRITEDYAPGYRCYKLEVWLEMLGRWSYCRLQGESTDDAVRLLREHAALDAKVKGYGDNYEITEVL